MAVIEPRVRCCRSAFPRRRPRQTGRRAPYVERCLSGDERAWGLLIGRYKA